MLYQTLLQSPNYIIISIIVKKNKNCCPLLTTVVSGSPILQNGKIIGAVTHVLVNDPTRGYGIFIENMLEVQG